MEIYCIKNQIEEEIIKRLKRKKWEWKFLISGEASESPGHQWDATFFIGKTKNNRFWALQHREWFRKIVVIAEVESVEQIDESKIAQEMLRKYKDYGGDYIEICDDIGDIPLPDTDKLYGW
jgi:hypothetical protein